jgi:hypothetical protein
MPIPNSDFVPAESFPGVPTGADSTGAPGTSGASGRPADSAGATVTGPAGSWQDRFPAGSGTVQPGQSEPTAINPDAGTGSYTDTGAGRGNPNPYRHPNGGER